MNSFLLSSENIISDDLPSLDIRFVVLEKLEYICKKFTFPQLNENSMNFRNVILQNLFKVIGKIKEIHTTSKSKCSIIEFFNKELEEQLDSQFETYKKTMNLKSLLNMGVCLNGLLIRIHEQGQLGHRNLLLSKILHLGKQSEKQ